MEVDKQLRFESHKSMHVEFTSNNEDVMTHGCVSSVALALFVRLQLWNYPHRDAEENMVQKNVSDKL